MANIFPKGSEWRKWDLQIQPIKDEWLCDVQSKKTEIKNATREYLNKAIEKEISVVAITDHNCGAAIDSALEIISEENLDITVLPGVEIDVNTGYQILVILNPVYKTRIRKQTWEEVITHFLNHVCQLSSPVINSQGQAESIGGDIHEILDKICKEDIGLAIFAHSQGEKGLFKKTTGANRKKFFEQSVAGKYYFALDHKTNEDIAETKKIISGWGFNPDNFALIKSSDAHQASETGNGFTWIKSETTFEGLKQIIYDPQSRIAVQVNQPVQPNNVIESITFNISSDAKITVKQKDGSEKEERFCFAGANSKYYLSPFFNCFIGGRGSGKSTILNFLGQHSKDPKSSQSFWEKLQPSFNTTDLDVFSFGGVSLFEFIGQSEVESFATDKEAFTNAIYERANIRSGGILEKDEEKLEKLLKRVNSFQSLIEKIEELRAEKKSKEKEKATLENAVEVTKSKEYSEIVELITKKSNQKQKLEGWRTTIDELRNSIKELKEQHFPVGFNDEPDEEIAVESEERDDIAQKYKEAYEQAKKNITNAEEILAPTNFKDLVKKENSLAKEIEEQEKKLSDFLKKAGLSDENILQVKSAPQKIVKIDDELSKLNKKIEDKQKEINEYDEVLKEVEKVKKEYEDVIEEGIKPLVNILKEQAEGNNQDIKSIGLNYFFDEREAWIQIADEFYSYFSKQHRGGERPDLLKSYIVEHKETFADDHKKIKEFLDKQGKKVEKLNYIKFLKDVFDKKPNYQIFLTIRDKHLNDVTRYKRIQVLYDGKDIEHASFGQKCTSVMVVLLLFGNYPLIIDEPEAHLDSSLIANYLVPLIKRKKNNRQIIFATHNANFVVNGDAEKIFILKNETGITEIIETTIENLAYRDELLKLEGGRDAFKKRGEKLHI